MGLFSKKDDATPPPALDVEGTGRKGVPTPSRREAEAARMARLHPELDPKKSKQLARAAQSESRQKQFAAAENSPARQLMRDVVDSRWNVGEIALPIMLLILGLFLLPQLQSYLQVSMYLMYGVIAALLIDFSFMLQRYRKLAAERLPGVSLRGMGFYGWNRQMAFRRWRLPKPRVARGDEI